MRFDEKFNKIDTDFKTLYKEKVTDIDEIYLITVDFLTEDTLILTLK